MATTTLPLSRTRPGVLYPHAQWYFLAAMVTTWIGFSRSYFAVIRTEPWLHHVHGALMGGWIALLAVQPVLYQRGRIQLHRTLGRWGVYLLVPGIVVCGFFMVRSMARGSQLPPFILDHLAFLDVFSLIQFPIFVALSILYGKNLQLHARYMAATVVLMLPPAVARALFLVPFMRHFLVNVNTAMAISCVLLLLLIGDDLRKGRIRAPYPIALACTATAGLVSNFAPDWTWWQSVLRWIASS